MYYFLRSAEYLATYGDASLYESFDMLAKKEVQPAIMAGQKVTKKYVSAIVYCAPTLRAQQTGLLFDPTVRIRKQLDEVVFTMDQLMTESEFAKLPVAERVNKARQLFFQKLADNQLSESFSEVVQRLADLAEDLIRQHGTAVCISHSFAMKVLEVAATHPEVIVQPKDLLKYYDGSAKAYEHLQGFSLTKEQLRNFIAATASSKRESTLK